MKPVSVFFSLTLWLGLACTAMAQSVATYAVGQGPCSMAFDKTNLHVANSGEQTVSKINPKTGAVILTYATGGHPQKVIYDGSYIWATNSEGSVSKLTTAGVLRGTYPVGSVSIDLAVDGSYLWATLPYENAVAKINRSTGAVIGKYATGAFPFGILFDGTYIWVVNGPYLGSGSLTKLNRSGVTVGTFTTDGTTSREIVTDGVHLYVSNFHSGTVSKIRKTDGAVVDILTTSVGVHDMFYSARQLWTANPVDDTVSRFNTSDDALLETIPFAAGAEVCSIGFDGIRVWSTNRGNNSVSAF